MEFTKNDVINLDKRCPYCGYFNIIWCGTNKEDLEPYQKIIFNYECAKCGAKWLK
jgi:ribosomal protein S27AE